MSIFATFLDFDGAEGPAPIVYRGSHILPSDDDERGGMVMLALIPSFINRTGDDGPEDEAPLPWLRLSGRVQQELVALARRSAAAS